jgi:hypothetical protein
VLDGQDNAHFLGFYFENPALGRWRIMPKDKLKG